MSETLNKIITKVNTSNGAPLGRSDIGFRPATKRVYDCKVPMNGAYDKGGAYWGLNPNDTLRVEYCKDLSYVKFYWR